MRSSVRIATLSGYIGVAESLGLDAVELMASVGLEPADLAAPDRWVPAAAVARLLERSARQADAPDLALRLAEQRRLSTLGPLSVVLREEPDLRSALELLLRYERSYNEALRMRLSESNGIATISVEIDPGELVPSGQAVELAVAALHGIIREFVGEVWEPIAVLFSHNAPADTSAHRRAFGSRVRFQAELSGLVFSARFLQAKNAMADPLMRPYTQQLLASMVSERSADTSGRVREAIGVLLPVGRCSMDQVARTMGVDRRTLHRHLAAEGQTFSGLLHATRVRLAERHLANDRYSITEVSELLGFSAPSAFTRWFNDQFGVSPRQWRQARAAGSSAPPRRAGARRRAGHGV